MATFQRLYSPAELKALSRTGTERIEAALDLGSEAAREEYARIEAALRWFCGLYLEWIGLTSEYLLTEHGRQAQHAGLRPERTAELAVRSGMTLEDLVLAQHLLAEPENSQANAFDRALAEADAGAALAVWRRTETVLKFAHDLRREAITDLLGLVFREHGLQSLEAAQAYAARRGPWVEAMPAELSLDPKERLAELTFLLTTSCFFEFEVEERADRWVLWVDVCGNCGRQLADRYGNGQGWGFEVIQGPGRATFGLDAVTVYQSHFALIHHVYAIQAVGAPCPAIRCAGMEAVSKPCEWHVFKDPATTDGEFYEMVGMKSTAGEA